jgi:porin
VLRLVALALLAAVAAGSAGAESRSGFVDVPQFGGPSSVGAELEESDRVKQPLARVPFVEEALAPWFGFKQRVNEALGLQFGTNYNVLAQWATRSPGERGAAGHVAEFFGNWTLLGRDSDHRGSLVVKGEHRTRLGTDVAPQSLGFEVGSILLTGTKFSDFGWGLTNLYWRQELLDGKLAFVAGTVDATDYLDVYGLINPLTAFQNFAFSTNPTIAIPDQGLGAAAGAFLGDHVYAVAGIADANGSPTRLGFDTFFDDREYFTHLELGWTSSFEQRYLDNVHLTAWHVDARRDAGVPSSWGLTFSAATFLDERWMPFLRAGWSDGDAPLLNATVAAGLGYYMAGRRDLMGFGFSWGRPAAGGLRDQYTLELFYRLQLTQHIAVTPDVQLIADPALSPEDDWIAVFGLRLRLSL